MKHVDTHEKKTATQKNPNKPAQEHHTHQTHDEGRVEDHSRIDPQTKSGHRFGKVWYPYNK